jgi:multidrug transporter EmrE-like cation transporter
MLLISLALLLVAIALGATGQVLLKAGLRELGDHPPPLAVLKSIVASRLVFSGFACYGLSSLLYIVALSRLDLSYAYPLIAISYVMVAVLAWRFLNEPIPRLRIVGLVVVMVGVIILALSHVRPAREGTQPTPPPVTQNRGSQ